MHLEDIKIVDINKLPYMEFEDFSYRCKERIDNKSFEMLRKKVGLYRKGVVKSQQLFDEFCKTFGFKDVVFGFIVP